MKEQQLVRSILEKCRLFYDDELISGEIIIERYLSFLAEQFNAEKPVVSFAFHTGSPCFDIASVVALVMGVLSYNLSTNDEILKALKEDDMVLYKNKRYRWGGIALCNSARDEPSIERIILKQDAVGKNGPSTIYLPYQKHKHLVKPYYGESYITDGRGVRQGDTNRIDFFSYVLNIPLADVPSTIDVSAVVVADRTFIETIRHLKLKYADNKHINLSDIVPVSYYTSSGEQFQVGSNPSKTEATIKVTSNLTVARNLVLSKEGSQVIGLLLIGNIAQSYDSSELNDLLRRRSLKFSHMSTGYNPNVSDYVMEQYENADIFACTKETLESMPLRLNPSNLLTQELNQQMRNIINHTVHPLCISGLWGWPEYKSIKKLLFSIKQSNWNGEEKDEFILSSMALLNLFTSSFFSMQKMDLAVEGRKLSPSVTSPEKRLTYIQDIAINFESQNTLCREVADSLLDVYAALHTTSPKEETLKKFIRQHTGKKIALIVPKAYYCDLFSLYFQNETSIANVECITANRFEYARNYDIVLVPGDVIGKNFDPIRCYSAPDIYVLLYDYEKTLFDRRNQKFLISERRLNSRTKGIKGLEFEEKFNKQELPTAISEETVREFADLDAYVESIGAFSIRRLLSSSSINTGTTSVAEVKYVGTFITGEQILFSKYYSAVLFDQSKKTITEKKPENLSAGDVIVFTKNDDYTRNIVDTILDQLFVAKRLSEDLQDAIYRAFYWKTALREYREKNQLTYNALVRQLRRLNCNVEVSTIRQWLAPDSHITGPQKESTMLAIATLTQDPNLNGCPEGFFEACRIVRQFRRSILGWIAQAINDKLSNKSPPSGLEIVYENVGNLSETLELESVYELDEIANVNSNLVNRPLLGTEVMM